MKALLWEGVNELSVQDVPDPKIINEQDAIVKVTRTVTCGSDLHLIGGYNPLLGRGDGLGDEFIWESVEGGAPGGPDQGRGPGGGGSFLFFWPCSFCCPGGSSSG